jgi:hypothetical protein
MAKFWFVCLVSFPLNGFFSTIQSARNLIFFIQLLLMKISLRVFTPFKIGTTVKWIRHYESVVFSPQFHIRSCTQFLNSPTIRSKNYWDNRINALLNPNSMLCEWLKRENSTHFSQHWSWGQGRPTYFKMAKNVKSLIIFARDCLRWRCLGVSCPKFEILSNSSDQVDKNWYISIN